MRDYRQNSITTNRVTLPVSLLVTCVIVGIAYWKEPLYSFLPLDGIIRIPIDSYLSAHASILLNQAIIWLNAVLLVRLNEKFALIDAHTSAPLLFMVLFCNFGINTPYYNNTLLFSLLFIILISILFSSYQLKISQYVSFAISLILGIGALINSDFVWYLPLFWIGMHYMKSLTFKSFLASLVGIVTPLWLVFSGNMEIGYTLKYDDALQQIIRFTPLSSSFFTTPANYPIFLILFLGLYALVMNMQRFYNNSIKVRAFHGFIIRTTLYSLILLCIKSDQYLMFMSIINICIALQISYYFVTARQRSATLFFYLVLIAFLTLYIWNLLQDSVNGAILVSL